MTNRTPEVDGRRGLVALVLLALLGLPGPLRAAPPDGSTALELLEDARARASEQGSGMRLVRIDLVGVPRSGRVDLTAEPDGQTISYGFANGRSGALVTYTQASGEPEPYVHTVDWSVVDPRYWSDDLPGRVADSPLVAAEAVDLGLRPPYSVGYFLDGEGRPVVQIGAVDGTTARLDAETGDVIDVLEPPRGEGR